MTGAHTVSLVGTYKDIPDLITAWDGVTVTAVTDYCYVIVTPGGSGRSTYTLIKVEVAA